jgi:hypothetical protein
MNDRTVFSDAFVVARVDTDLGVLRYVRNAVPFTSLEAVREHHAAIAAAIATVAVSELGLLIDVREAPARNDEAFEAEMTRGVGKLLVQFRGHAFLVKTAVGGLQVRRLASERGLSTGATFSDEAAALEHLRAGR